MARLDALWSRRGSPRPASQTPLEHLARLPAQRFPADAVEGARRVVERVYSARFGGAMLSPAEIQSLQAQIAAIQRSLSP